LRWIVICRSSIGSARTKALRDFQEVVVMKIALGILAVLLIIALLFGSSFVGRRNQMAVKREAVNAAWSQVDVVLQRRADLIPNLVETVKGFAVQEQTVFGDIAKARSALLSANTPTDKIAANQRLDSALGRLLVVVENYPQLKSNENFLRLQDELAGTENRIAVERRRYNEAVQDYNTYISLFPNNLVASLSGFPRNDAYFKTDEGARQAPKVNFDYSKPAAPAPAPAKP
jgi:LemA protein